MKSRFISLLAILLGLLIIIFPVMGIVGVADLIALSVLLISIYLLIVGISIIGAIIHNTAQLGVSILITKTPMLIYYLPVLIVFSLFSGTITGVIIKILKPYNLLTIKPIIYVANVSDEEINDILSRARGSVEAVEQNLEDIEIKQTEKQTNTEGIKIEDVSTDTFKGYLMIIDDPSRVDLVVGPKVPTVGSTTSQIVEAYGAVAGINAGGLADDAAGTGAGARASDRKDF